MFVWFMLSNPIPAASPSPNSNRRSYQTFERYQLLMGNETQAPQDRHTRHLQIRCHVRTSRILQGTLRTSQGEQT